MDAENVLDTGHPVVAELVQIVVKIKIHAEQSGENAVQNCLAKAFPVHFCEGFPDAIEQIRREFRRVVLHRENVRQHLEDLCQHLAGRFHQRLHFLRVGQRFREHRENVDDRLFQIVYVLGQRIGDGDHQFERRRGKLRCVLR